jgi:FK506-binding protein 4/5
MALDGASRWALLNTGLELGLRHMRKGEKGFIRATSKYGFGPYGRKNVGFGGTVEVPGEADIEYEVEVTEIYPTFNPKEAPSVARLTEASLKKQLGNGFFHHEDYTRAIRCYQSAVKSLDPAEVDEEEEGEEAMKESIKMYCDISNNLAMALMKLERYKDACEVCVKVIELEPNNVKALYRGGVASMEQVSADSQLLATVCCGP